MQRVLFVLLLAFTWLDSHAQSSHPQPAKLGRMPDTGEFYPDSARVAGRQGSSSVKVCVDASSNITSVNVVTSSGHLDLDEAAAALGSQGSYKAGTSADGEAVPSCVIFRVKFEADAGAYVGDFQNGERHGKGTLIFRDGSKYVGEFRDGKPHGRGTITWPDGTRYVGEFRDGLRHRNGVLTSGSGQKYVGEWKDDNISGKGVLEVGDGSKYVGEFLDGKYHGQGTLTFPDGRKHVGEFRDGMPNGRGTFTLPDGTQYAGEFKDGMRHRWGELTKPNGDTYLGEWKDDNISGQGVATFRSGTKYVGDFQNGKFHGRGDLTFKVEAPLFANSTGRYVGEFENGVRNGFGTLYSAKGDIAKQGVWKDGNLVSSKTEDQYRRELVEAEGAKVRKAFEERKTALAEVLNNINLELNALLDAEEQRRIAIEGDGSPDDLACKARKLSPSTVPYTNCRNSLVVAREAREEQDRLLAEKRYQEKLELERQAKVSVERQRAQQEERERQMRLAAQRERERQDDRRRRREEAAAKDPYFYAKEQCRDLGFKDKTEKFGTCVLELSARAGVAPPSALPSSLRGDGSPDDSTCASYGYSAGTSGYADCRMKLDQARRDYERELRAYEAEKAAYEQRVAEGQAEARRRQQERQAQYGFCVAACSSQPGSTALSCMSRCGAASAGLSFDPGAPPARPSGQTTYLINGQIINCNTSPSGSLVTCY